MRISVSVLISRVIMLALLMLLPLAVAPAVSAANRFDYGCCLPPNQDCFPGDDALSTEQVFRDACDNAEGDVTSAAQCTAQQYCDMGCCCAAPNVPGSAAINATENLLEKTKWGCMEKSTSSAPFTWSAKTQGKTCVQICGGTTGGDGGQPTTYTLGGRVRQGTTPERAKVWVSATGVDDNRTTDAAGLYQFTLPSNKQYLITVEPDNISCRPQSTTLTLNRNRNDVNFNLDCTPQAGCANNKPVITNIVLERGTDGASFDIVYNSECGDFDSFVPLVCKKDKPCQPLPRTEDKHVVVSDLEPNTQYCFQVRAYEDPTGMTESDKICTITTGDAACMQGREGPWCGATPTGGSAVFSCDDKNKLTTNQCPAEQMCSETTEGPKCVPKSDCAKCNGLLGLFAKLNIKVPLGLEGYAPACSAHDYCYKEDTFVPSYKDCTKVTSCANYTSSLSCAADKCGITSCEWRNGNPELGTGVCTSTAPGVAPSCRQCAAGFGHCNATLCALISSDCYYDGVANEFFRDGHPQCIPKSEMACRFYDTAADCGNARVDIQYTGAMPTGGTHARTQNTDKFHFGVCNWVPAAGDREARCIKNSDNLINPADPKDDCQDAGKTGQDLLRCLNDTTPPTTTVTLKEPAVYGSSEINALPFGATDDVTLPEHIRTFFCASNTSARCYPNSTLAQVRIDDVNSTYSIYYYSVDRNANFEEIKNITVKAYKDNVTRLTKITIEEVET